jgi:hypothetical protein
MNVLIFLIYAQNGKFQKEKEKESLTLLCPSLVFIFTSPKKNSLKKYYNNITLPLGPYLFQLENLFCLSHRKIHWTMSVGNVGLKICLLETSNFMVTLTFFFLGVH